MDKGKALAAIGAALLGAFVLRQAGAAEPLFEADFTVVDDESSLPLPGARIALGTVSAVTDASGQATIPLALPGIYNFAVSLAGYETYLGSFEAK